ncbi:hypothetical protein GQ457_04G019420 [Hibiscus cannabinus]
MTKGMSRQRQRVLPGQLSRQIFKLRQSHDSWLWHRKLGHASMSKHHRVSFKPINDVSTNRVLQLIHMELFGPIRTISLGLTLAIFLGYSLTSKAYRVFNKRTLVVEKSIHVVFDDNLLPRKDSCDDDDLGILETNCGEQSSKVDEMPTKEETQDPPLEALKDISLEEREVSYPRELNYVKVGEILDDPSKGVTTRSSLRNTYNYVTFISCIEPKNIKEASNDGYWILAIQDELNQFERSKVWTLVDRPHDKSTIGTKWVFRNKLDESSNIVRNKARLVAQGYTQEEGIDFDETYKPIARMEAIRMLLAFACHHKFKPFQMDVKSTFLNGFISEEVYVEQPPSFEDPNFPNHVFKLSKALYGLKQAHRVCMMGELSFFLGLQIKQRKDDTFINQAKYINEKLKKFGLENVKPQATPMSSSSKLDKDEGDSTFDLHAYSDADYGGCKINRKSTSGTSQFLGNMVIYWFSKKQNSVALSTIEAEYISAGSCRAQVLW